MNRRTFLKTAAGFAASASFTLPVLGKTNTENASEGSAMAEIKKDFIIKDVPRIENTACPDIFTDALKIALSYKNEELNKRFPEGIYDSISGFSGRGWLIGFDDACFYWEKYDKGLHESFPVSGLESIYKHPDTMLDAVEFAGYKHEFLWNEDCQYKIDKGKAKSFINMAEKSNNENIRQYVTNSLVEHQRPVVVLLHLSSNSIVDFALLTGYESQGQAILGRSPHQNPDMDNSGEYGYFRMDKWEREVLAVMGVGKEKEMDRDKHPCFIAIQNALRRSRGYTEGTRYYGFSAYDAWERAILDDDNIVNVDNEIVSRRFVYHILLTGYTASQKAFTKLPKCKAPSHGVISGYVERAQAGPGIIHGLMWDIWRVIGLRKGFLSGLEVRQDVPEPYLYWDDDEDIITFKDRAVRERIAKIIRRAKQVDEQAIKDLQTAKEEWMMCRGRGNDYPCYCKDKPCSRV
ncbi:hypothetical protein GF312_16600 [Candidatus Poribacteria bacterium]|nr:hypothetical protein [Candidatus Poribacteria bacterium]